MAEARKTVTVVFADVSDSTALGERLDPEALRRVMERYFAEAETAFEHHGGTVEKFIGDAVVAVFGIPVAHEDDALRAVRAAQELREAMTRVNADLERERGVTLGVRTGINTGEVVAGDPSGGQFFVTGDAVNVAARLEQTAPPGEIVLGETTHRLVRDVVEAEALEQLALKGKTEAIAAYRFCALVEDESLMSAHRFDTPFIGRSNELARLLESFERSKAGQAPTLVTVLGPAGIGKTRLAGALVAEVGEGAIVLQGRCLSYGEGITFWPLQEILRGLPARPAGAPDPEQAQTTEDTFWAYRKLFEALARERPLLLVLEDIHWAEPTLLDLIEHVVEWTSDAAITVVCLARPDLLDERPGWSGERLELEPLPKAEAEELVAALAEDLEPSVRTRALEAAEGNPLFLEQLLALAVEDGQEVAIPSTIHALLAARLDRVGAEERALLERAAIVGKEFWRGALVALSPPATEVSPLLQRLVRRRLVSPDRSSFVGEDAFHFGHILIRDAAYAAIRKETRAGLHEQFANWLEKSGSPYEEIVGYHLEQACRYSLELGVTDRSAADLAVRAGAKLGAAGESALARNDLAAAVNLLSRATDLYEVVGEPRLDLRISIGAALFPLGEGPRALAVLDEALAAASAAGEPALEWRARLERDYVFAMLDPGASTNEEGLRWAQQAIPVLEALGDDRALARAWRSVSQGHYWEGRSESSLEASERALEYARGAGDRQVEVWALRSRLMALSEGPRPVADAAHGCEELLENTPGQELVACALEILAVVRAMQSDFEQARHLVDRARAIHEELGLLFRRAVTIGFRSAHVHARAGDLVATEREQRLAIDLLESMGDKGARSTVTANLARTLYALGRYPEAERQVNLAEQLAAVDDRQTLQEVWPVRAMILARQGDLERAKAAAEEALRIVENTDDLNTQGCLWIDEAEVFLAAGDQQGASSSLKRAMDLLERKGNVVMAERAYARLAELPRSVL
jgi:class 3 adenylate cyclase/tetratricopeptide (TPR) repeat protein